MAEANFSLQEMARHSVTNTLTYRQNLVNGRAEEKPAIFVNAALYCLEHGLNVQALGSLHVARRFGMNDVKLNQVIADLEADVEATAPVAANLAEGFTIVRAGDNGFARLQDSGAFAGGRKLFKTTPLGCALQQVKYGAGRQDISFALLYRRAPVALIRCDIWLDEGVTDSDTPVTIEAATGAPAKRFAQAVGMALDLLTELGRRYGACNVLVEDSEIGPVETAIGRSALSRSFLPEILMTAFVDLTAGQDVIWADVRKSFRPLIKSEQRRVSLSYFNNRDSNDAIVGEWRRRLDDTTHAVTPAVISFVAELARQGKGEIAAGTHADGGCRAITATIDDGNDSLYFAGHYLDADEDGKSGHAMVYDAMMRAKARGQRRFFLFRDECGPTRYVTDGFLGKKGDKWTGVIDFKRGFTSRFERILAYKKPL